MRVAFSRAFRFISAGAALLALFVTPLQARDWIDLPNCRLDADVSNDADSFHVKAQGKEYIFRLYFVDAPETDASFPERVAEQAKYFGLTPQQTLQLGDYSKKFTKQKLTQPFTVRTRMQEALGRSSKQRYYAFIQTAEGDLGEMLVANGMARVHGASVQVGRGTRERQRRKLQRLEREAKQQKVGAWGASVGRMTARLPLEPAKGTGSSFDAFFHPERVVATKANEDAQDMTPAPTAAPLVPPPITRPTPLIQSPPPAANAAATSQSKLDPNTATAEQLMAIKGIGPILAGRIIEARPYKNSNDLQKAKGIGPKKYEAIRPFFIDPPPDATKTTP